MGQIHGVTCGRCVGPFCPALGLALATGLGLVGCIPDVAIYEPQPNVASVAAPDAGWTDAAAALDDAGLRSVSSADWDAGETVQLLPQSDGSVTEAPGACGASVLSATSVVVEKEVEITTEVVSTKPVMFYIMFDQSLSMGASKLWQPAVSALKSFFNAERSHDVGVALQYFPLSGGKCSTGEGYVTPEVSVDELPDHVDMLEASLDAHEPVGLGTPMQGALVGVTEFCKTYQSEHPGEQCVSILVTDGKPELSLGCKEDSATLVAIARGAHDAGVTTFAVGLQGANFALLDEIALQGGAPDCDPTQPAYACDVSSGAEKLADALTSIRDTVVTKEVHTELVKQVERVELTCEWSIPLNSEADGFDPEKVNIRLSDAADETMLVRVASREACVDNGWYFDDSEAPSRFIACPSVCDSIERTPDAKIDILLGCRTWLPE